MSTTLLIAVIVAAASSLGATQRQPSATTLTTPDREEIELLSSRYALALGSCDAERYADLFTTPDGWFASGSRGQVRGHAKLVELVRSYDCHYSESGVKPPHAPGVEVPYKLQIDGTPGG